MTLKCVNHPRGYLLLNAKIWGCRNLVGPPASRRAAIGAPVSLPPSQDIVSKNQPTNAEVVGE